MPNPLNEQVRNRIIDVVGVVFAGLAAAVAPSFRTIANQVARSNMPNAQWVAAAGVFGFFAIIIAGGLVGYDAYVNQEARVARLSVLEAQAEHAREQARGAKATADRRESENRSSEGVEVTPLWDYVGHSMNGQNTAVIFTVPRFSGYTTLQIRWTDINGDTNGLVSRPMPQEGDDDLRQIVVAQSFFGAVWRPGAYIKYTMLQTNADQTRVVRLKAGRRAFRVGGGPSTGGEGH